MHRELEQQRRVIRVHLDAQAWTEQEDHRTANRALDYLDQLADTFSVELVVTLAIA